MTNEEQPKMTDEREEVIDDWYGAALVSKPQEHHVGMEDARVLYLYEIEEAVELMRRAEPRASSALMEAAKAALKEWDAWGTVGEEMEDLRTAIEAEEARALSDAETKPSSDRDGDLLLLDCVELLNLKSTPKSVEGQALAELCRRELKRGRQ
jgi:hypothetical protein